MFTFEDNETAEEYAVSKVNVNEGTYTVFINTSEDVKRIAGILEFTSRTSYERDEIFNYTSSDNSITITGKDAGVAMTHIANAFPSNMSEKLTQQINVYIDSDLKKTIVKKSDIHTEEPTIRYDSDQKNKKHLPSQLTASATTATISDKTNVKPGPFEIKSHLNLTLSSH